jgi:catechol 2,3-dioxygenase-like lactoylglutathione lyase family enzyme
MSVQLNHTIVFSRDKRAAAAFLTEILGLPPATRFGPFLAVRMTNGITLDFYDADREIAPQHYAFLVSEREFDDILGRIRQRTMTYWADPFHHQADEINTHDGGRGVYFEDPSGHNLEILTRPYSSGG